MTSPIAATPEEWRSLLDALPRCDGCDRPATRSDDTGLSWCDRHGGGAAKELAHAAIVRAAVLRAEGVV